MASLLEHGFLRIATAAPRLRVADCPGNVERILGLLARAESDGVAVLVLPELAITGYTCGDLFQQTQLQVAARAALERLVRDSARLFSGLFIVGVPLVLDDQLFNCGCAISHGVILGVVPKTFIPNYKEFYERRWFAPVALARSTEIELAGGSVHFGTHCLFEAANVPGLLIGVEVCEDLWVPIPPSSYQALDGATLLVNLSASNETIGKAAYRRQLVVNQSARCLAAYAYASCGVDESTTDIVFGGHCLIAENGKLLGESARFERDDVLLSADIDLELLRGERLRLNSFGDARVDLPQRTFERIGFVLEPATPPAGLKRSVEAHPFVPAASAELGARCAEIFHTQVAGLARRLEHIGKPSVAIGISGGLDSTLALIVTCKTMDTLGEPRSKVNGFTLPGFGTTARTLGNAQALMQQLGVSSRAIDIRALCLEEMQALGHRPFGIDVSKLTVEQFGAALQQVPAEQRQDLVFENVQARRRTSLLMNAGFVIGTGDLSELALGWCTYNADHMSMYNPNVSIPKTLVKFLVQWAAQHEFDGPVRQTLLDVAATQISPELLPAGANGEVQSTEAAIGPYELHDFFLFHFLRYGATPAKILFLAQQARFERAYPPDEVRRWLRVFLQRFFMSQYKRSCLPDGPKVGSVSVSPRGDWRMPSDAVARVWLEQEAAAQERGV